MRIITYMGLSKSKYTTYCQCPKALWLKTYDPDKAAPIDEGAQARFEAGNEVGDLAMGLFGDFVEVTTTKEDGSLDLVAMIEKTKQCLTDGTENIAEASFAWEGNYCAVDILHKTRSTSSGQAAGWAIYEVKSMHGSFSIKKVLPALFPDDPELDYHNLTGGVQNGGDAMTIYPKMGKMTPEEREETRRALLDYCGLDTYAMVKVWEKLVEVSR